VTSFDVASTGQAGDEVADAEGIVADRSGGGRLVWLRWVLEASGAGLIAVAIAGWAYRIWDQSLGVPLNNYWDSLQSANGVKTIATQGWFVTHNERMGAPFGRTNADWPTSGESIQRSVIGVASVFTDNLGYLVNGYFFFGFFLVASVSFLVVRSLRFSPLVAGAVAVVYSMLPYHFFHWESHLLRSAYYSAPIGALIVLWVLSYRSALLKDSEVTGRSWSAIRANVRWGRIAVLVGLGVVVGLSETMTLFFTCGALLVAAVLVAVRDRSAGVLVPAALVLGFFVVIFGLALVPNLLHWSEEGRNTSAVNHPPAAQERFGLKISQMVLPAGTHRLEVFRELQSDAAKNTRVPSEGGQSLGLLGAGGMLVLTAIVLTRGVPWRSRAPVGDREVLLRHSGLLVMVLILLGTISGYALLAGVAGFTQVRTWNRVVVLIGFFGLVAVGVCAEWAIRRFGRSRTTRRVLAVCIPLVVLGIGVWDTAVPYRSQQAAQLPNVNAIRALADQIERDLPAGAAVFQLPVVPYPEGGSRGRMQDYEELLPILWSDDLRFSYGGNKGRPEADWQRAVDSGDPGPQLLGLRGLGFDGILVDTWLYDDSGAAVTASLDAALGPATLAAGAEQRWRYWDLRSIAADRGKSTEELRAAAEALVGPDLLVELPVTPA
jgi:hypothetical protein